MNHWTEAHNIVVDSGLESPYRRDELIGYLKDKLVPATEMHAEGVLDYWLNEGYMEEAEEDKEGTERYRFTNRAANDVFD
jgi:hypothetical protein